MCFSGMPTVFYLQACSLFGFNSIRFDFCICVCVCVSVVHGTSDATSVYSISLFRSSCFVDWRAAKFVFHIWVLNLMCYNHLSILCHLTWLDFAVLLHLPEFDVYACVCLLFVCGRGRGRSNGAHYAQLNEQTYVPCDLNSFICVFDLKIHLVHFLTNQKHFSFIFGRNKALKRL